MGPIMCAQRKKDMAQETVQKNGKPPVSVPPPGDNGQTNGTGPLHERDYAEVIGAFKDDPMLDAMMENIRQRRREIDADDSIE